MFLALAIVCDDYFVMSLEKICEVSGIIEALTLNSSSSSETSLHLESLHQAHSHHLTPALILHALFCLLLSSVRNCI